MKVACPTCGADVEFRFDTTLVRVCDSCASAVTRTDRGAETLGKFADLAPIESPLALFTDGKYDGETFILIGLAQVTHAKGGTWQEWYARFSGDKLGWLAEAQGRMYLTFDAAIAADLVPGYDAAVPGSTVELAGNTYTITERGEATYSSARGEIPYRLTPGQQFKFADAQGEGDRFATIDYSGDAPTVYLGRLVTAAELGVSGGEAAAPGTRTKQGGVLRCPKCAAPVPLRVPDQTLRVVCPACDSLLDVHGGTLAILGALATKPQLAIPLGARVTLGEGALTVVGYVERSAFIDNHWWPFYEYLLWEAKVGFRWLVSSDGHWSYVQPVTAAAIENAESDQPTYAKRAFAAFSRAYLKIDAVYGELYWRAQVGDQVLGEDYVAAPAMLSRETAYGKRGIEEVTWSLSTYLAPAVVARACNAPVSFPPPRGVGPHQPNGLAGWGYIATTALVLLGVLGAVKLASSPGTRVGRAEVTVAAAPAPSPDPTAEAPGTVAFTDPFRVGEHANLRVALEAPGLDNNYIYAAVDLVNDTTGEVTSADTNIEYYSGVEDGEGWTEGDRREDLVFGDLAAGSYTVRVEAQQGGPLPESVLATVDENVWRGRYFGYALGAALLVFGFARWRSNRFERARMENQSLDATPPAGTPKAASLVTGKAWITHRERGGGAPDPDADDSSTFGAD